MSRTLFLSAAMAAALSAMPLSAQAFPAAAALAGTADPAIVRVAGGCGPAFHRGPLGGCRPNVFMMRRPVVCRIVGLIPHRVCRR